MNEMQVFMPLPDFKASVATLDPRRLGNQIYNEGLILIRGGWRNHPASKMWLPYRHALALYLIAGLDEMKKRNPKFDYPHHRKEFESYLDKYPLIMPPFMGNEKFHASHRSNLLRKKRAWYSQFGWTEPSDLPYYWPTELVGQTPK